MKEKLCNNNLPCGVSKWINQGEKYEYFDFYKNKLIKQIEAIKEAVRKQTGSSKYDDCYDDIIKLIK